MFIDSDESNNDPSEKSTQIIYLSISKISLTEASSNSKGSFRNILDFECTSFPL